MMTKVSRPCWDQLKQLVREANRELLICSPWLPRSGLLKLKAYFDELGPPPKVKFWARVADANTDSELLLDIFRTLRRKGIDVEVKDSPALHAKIYMADGRTALVTSANLSQSGFEHNLEMATLTSDASLLEQIVQVTRDIEAEMTCVSLEHLEYFVRKQRISTLDPDSPTPVIPIWRRNGNGPNGPLPHECTFYEYDLIQAHQHALSKKPSRHQNEALNNLRAWFQRRPKPSPAGTILVMPTGGGKTYTAVRFLYTNLLPQGYKVLWLAHTHHLLDQARCSFESGVGNISNGKARLNVRVVSGSGGYCPVSTLQTSDDVVIATLQTMTRAHKSGRPELLEFLNSTQGKLVVVFDEAHHAPAPTYRRLVNALFERFSEMYLLGMTATPTYTDEQKQGWLARLFPQDIIYQISPSKLMAEGILAKPIFEECKTNFTTEFDEHEYHKWINTYRDLPEGVSSRLAANRERNAIIADTYAKGRNRYGKTILFADRWEQCEQIRDYLEKRGVRADVIYSGRGSEKNAQVLEQFRRDELDVLINIRMLTEGTDIPDVNTVFLTRQTTSQILITQMVGRALRGPKFGGTENAYIVSFIDNWKHLINWAEYDQLVETPVVDRVYPQRLPLGTISGHIVRRLLDEMDQGIPRDVPFLTYMPIGWYHVNFETAISGSEDNETVRLLVMVFEREKESYERFIGHLSGQGLDEFADEELYLDHCQSHLDSWQELFFTDIREHIGQGLTRNLFHIVRHMAQNQAEPTFFYFEDRDKHNLDKLAQAYVDENLGLQEVEGRLRAEYAREDRYWKTFYPNLRMFKWEFMACVSFRQDTATPILPPKPRPKRAELPAQIKDVVKERDTHHCLGCGEDDPARLMVSRVREYGADNSLTNLQTLCRACRAHKGDQAINFQDHRTSLTEPPSAFPRIELAQVSDDEERRRIIRRGINFFYGCSAVKGIDPGVSKWRVTLETGNDPSWLEPHLDSLERQLQLIIKIETGDQMDAYCVKCRVKHPMSSPKRVTVGNERPALKDQCPECGTAMYRFISTKTE